jgi:cytochrome c-type biogenesis protein CcmH/NrfF
MIKFRAVTLALFFSAAATFGAASLRAQVPQGASQAMPPATPGPVSDAARELGKQIMCTCGCGDTAGTCSHPGAAFSGPCEVAKAKLKEVDQRMSQGESNSAILQTFVKEYGEAVLASPPAHGLNWFAWTFPGVAFAIGLGLIIMVIRQWRHRVTLAPSSGPAIPVAIPDHMRRRIERDTQQDD